MVKEEQIPRGNKEKKTREGGDKEKKRWSETEFLRDKGDVGGGLTKTKNKNATSSPRERVNLKGGGEGQHVKINL